MKNPLKIDPTRTVLLRREFGEAIRGRFQKLATAVRRLVGDDDVFGLAGPNVPAALATVGAAAGPTATFRATPGSALATNANPVWAFETDAKKMDAFKAWLLQAVATGVLEVAPGQEQTPWLSSYVKSAYMKGLMRAYLDAKKVGHAADTSLDFLEGGKAAFLQQAFSTGTATKKLEVLYTRSFDQLKGVTDQMASQMSRTLAESLANGDGAIAAANKLAATVDGLSRKRAQVIANTELMYAHSEGQLDSFEQLGIEDLDILAEWTTAHDSKVCPLCRPLEGTIYKTKEAHGLIPRHPNCRCTWIPAGVGEEVGGTTKTVWAGPGQGLEKPGTAPTGQTTGQVFAGDEINARLRESIKAEQPKAFAEGGIKAARDASTWKGSEGTIASKSHLKPTAKNKAAAAAELAKAQAAKKAATEKARAEAAAKKAAEEKAKAEAAAKAALFAQKKAGLKAVVPDLTDNDFKPSSEKLASWGLGKLLKAKGVTPLTDFSDDEWSDFILEDETTTTLDEQLAMVDKHVAKIQAAKAAHAKKLEEEKKAAEAAAAAAAAKLKAEQEAAAKAAAEAKALADAAALKAQQDQHSNAVKNGFLAKKYGIDKAVGFTGPGGKLTDEGVAAVAAKLGVSLDDLDPGVWGQLDTMPTAKDQAAMLESLAKALKKAPPKAPVVAPLDKKAIDKKYGVVTPTQGKFGLANISKIAEGNGWDLKDLNDDEDFWTGMNATLTAERQVAFIEAHLAGKAKPAPKPTIDVLAAKYGLNPVGIVKKDGELTVQAVNILGQKLGGYTASNAQLDDGYLQAIKGKPAAEAIVAAEKYFLGKGAPTATAPKPVTGTPTLDKYGLKATTGKLDASAVKAIVETHGLTMQDVLDDNDFWTGAPGNNFGETQAAAIEAWATKKKVAAATTGPNRADLLKAQYGIEKTDFLPSGKLKVSGLKKVGAKYGIDAKAVQDDEEAMALLMSQSDDDDAGVLTLKSLHAHFSGKPGAVAPAAPPTAPKTLAEHKTALGLTAADVKTDGLLKASALKKIQKQFGQSGPDPGLDAAILQAQKGFGIDKKADKQIQAAIDYLTKKAAGGAAVAPIDAATDALQLPNLADLTKVRDLPGSTKPIQVVDKNGKNWVMKSVAAGIKPDHLKSEGLADELYRRAGLLVPKGGVVQTAEGPVKLTEFLEGGMTLADWKKGKTAKQLEEMHAQIRKGFVADALIANHDVAGLSFDNIFVVGDKAYRIDNGGSLKYRAQGALKSNFAGKVLELDTLRDKALNAQTAAIFDKITDDQINDQIRDLLGRKAAILAAIEDKDLHGIMAARFNDLEARLPAPKADARAAQGTARRVEYGITEQSAERVKKARINGTNFAGDREDIEDNNMLVWEEVNEAGATVTRMQFKVTPSGSKKVEAALGQELQRAKKTAKVASGAVSTEHPKDSYADVIIQAAKTVNMHAKDGAYNVGKIDALEKAKKELSTEIANIVGKQKLTAADKVELEMLHHYMAHANTILDAKAKKGTTPILSPYVYKPPATKAAAAPPPTSDFRVRRDNAAGFRITEIENGRAKATTRTNKFTANDSYVIDAGDGVEIQFIPAATDVSRSNALALRGMVNVTVPEGASTQVLQKAMKTVEALGLDTKPPTPEYEELVYLHRTVYLRKDHNDATYKAIWDGPGTDAEKVDKIKEWATKKYKVDLTNPKYYNPQGETNTGYGDGFRHWYRWDLPPQQIAEEMKDYALKHNSSTESALFVQRLLQSGGEFTPTTARIRKGIDVRNTGGMSPDADLDTGGASYYFTRIADRTNPTPGTFYFKVSRLARQDAVTYDEDKYGRISEINQRKTNVADYKKLGKGGSYSGNETNFKEGLSLLDDLDFITAKDAKQRTAIIKAFKDNKVTHLNDGRAVEDVVIFGTTPPPPVDASKEFK
jgi:SPP1 gp7 family putative phage head morphogenesis protein